MAKKEHVQEEPKPVSILTKVGPWAFLIGLLIAVLTGGFIKPTPLLIWFLAVLGVIVGLLNISESEIKIYLLSTIAFLVSSSSIVTLVKDIPVIGAGMASYVAPVVTNIVIFIAPGAAVVALKALYSISRN